MAAEDRRAPRVVRERTNMSRAAAALRTDIDFAAAWAALWQAYGGTITSEPVPAIGFRREMEPISTAIGTVAVMTRNDDERMGALNALAAMLRLTGYPAMDAVFAHAGLGV